MLCPVMASVIWHCWSLVIPFKVRTPCNERYSANFKSRPGGIFPFLDCASDNEPGWALDRLGRECLPCGFFGKGWIAGSGELTIAGSGELRIADGGEVKIADGGEVKITAGVACVPEKPTLLWPGLSFQFVDFRTILISFFFFFFCKKKVPFRFLSLLANQTWTLKLGEFFLK